jgi:hypothetical protein
MLLWLLGGVGTAAFFAFLVIRNAEADDKQRKLTKRRPMPNTWQ